MFIFKDIYSKFKTQFKLETVLNGVVLAMILAILIIAGLALVRPVSVVHFQKIKQLSEQATYPYTQKMAQNLVKTPDICAADYFRLMHAYQREEMRVKQYPAIESEDQ